MLQGCQARGIEEDIFQNPDKLHLTLCTLVLTDNVERAEATNMLENCKRDVIEWVKLTNYSENDKLLMIVLKQPLRTVQEGG